MKRIILIIAISALFASCQKTNNTSSSNSTTSNQTVGINQITYQNGGCESGMHNIYPNYAHKNVNSGNTSLSQSTNKIATINFVTPSSTGNYTLTASNQASLIILDSTNCFGNYFNDTTTISILKYDAVGGLIEGAYNAKFKDLIGGKKMVVTGQFSIIRGADQ